jgi:hypothetical protein
MSQLNLFWQEESKESVFSPAASHVNRIAVRASVKALLTTATSGRNLPDSFASLSQAGVWLKMSQGYCQVRMDGSLEEYSGTWPRWGMMRSGVCTGLETLVRHTKGTGCLSWRTPQAHNANQGPKSKEFYERCLKTNESMITLTDQVRHNPGKMWPTPIARDFRHSGSKEGYEKRKGKHVQALNEEVCWGEGGIQKGGSLNPDWEEPLVGLPIGWTNTDGPPDQENRNTTGNRQE